MTVTQTTSATGTTAGARAHARAQEGTVVACSPTVPATTYEDAPARVAPEDIVWAERVAGGNYTHKVLARGTAVRLTDVTGDACASVLLYNAAEPFERLNVADTMKIQWQVRSGAGQVLLSDQGRALATVVEDSSGHHDALYGASSRARNEERYGDGQPQGPSPAGRELLVLAGAKHGLSRRDVPPCVSFFQGVEVGPSGRPVFTGSAGAGASLTLVTEMPCVLLLANAAHPLDPREEYVSTPLDVVAWRARATAPEAPAWNSAPERRRAYQNTAEYLRARGLA
ncbi:MULTISPECIES: urea amidolyase associated protein UAAP1 [Kocuria]|uniref:Urea amidolyase associated protein UAAP1 n=1 Tax=Kocuria oceani TaxID=988827 RepID=A0ABV9TKK6_9MICC|nr:MULTISPECIES: urea amidolyase associated protein UAAP1 [Kocuria]KLU10787.1 urea carboxylase [Kocuria sp. SM24M-10]